MKKIIQITVVVYFICLIFAAVSGRADTTALPKTGQTTSYETGDDGDLEIGVAWPDPRFTNEDGSKPINGDVVFDQLTGLMWTRDANLMPARDLGWDNDSTTDDGAVNWQHALDYVSKLNDENYLGYTDWRLPNINELESLVNAESSNQSLWLNSQGFNNLQSDNYWSSSTPAYYLEGAWVVYMLSGYVDGHHKLNHSYYVWPVRAGQCGIDNSIICLPITGQTSCYSISGAVTSCEGTGQDGELQRGVAWPNPRFVDHYNGTIVDRLTGLMWTKNANLFGGKRGWQQSLDDMSTMNSADGTYGYTDWRLPNKKELRSLCDYSTYSPALPADSPFTNVQSDRYWSSTTNAQNINDAWYVFISLGSLGRDDKIDKSYYAWPVRAGQCGLLGDSDLDAICDDGDNSGVVGDNPCTSGQTQNCDDNCIDVPNSGQQDADGDGLGDACDLCPDDPNKNEPGQCGCGIPDNDTDLDASADCQDNCLYKPNDSGLGTCVKIVGGVHAGTGVVCYGLEDCGENELCDMNQGDCNGNGIGDACECYADISGSTGNPDSKVDAFDLLKMKQEFNRTGCTPETCQADLNADGKVDSFDLLIMKVQFNKTGCPVLQ